jgi:hypothetical protein
MRRAALAISMLATASFLLPGAALADGLQPAPDAGSGPQSAYEGFFSPRRHQLDLDFSELTAIVDDSSLVRRREDSIAGSALHLGPDLGDSVMPTVELNGTFWLDTLDAMQFQFRYFFINGSQRLDQPVTFNGDRIAPGQDISASDSQWFTLGLFYERELTPWLRGYETQWPQWTQGWDVRPKIGLEFVYLDVKINNGSPKLISGNLEARGRFHDQELPVPTIGIELRRLVSDQLAFEMTLQGNWINKWDSLRQEGGTVYLSQSSFEGHWRIVYLSPALRGLHLFAGFAFYYYKQAETSETIGNLIRLTDYGPEVGLRYAF